MAASSASTWVTVPSRFERRARATQSGKWRGIDFMMKPSPPMPPGNAWMVSGRPRTWGSIAGATRS